MMQDALAILSSSRQFRPPPRDVPASISATSKVPGGERGSKPERYVFR